MPAPTPAARVADASDEKRDALHKFLQEQGSPGEGIREGALLTGWVIVTAWIDPAGDPWLAKAHAAELPTFAANGMHHEALYGDWPSRDEA